MSSSSRLIHRAAAASAVAVSAAMVANNNNNNNSATTSSISISTSPLSTSLQCERDEVREVSRMIFDHQEGKKEDQTDITSPGFSPASGVRISSDISVHSAIVSLGERFATNTKIQELIKEEMEQWLLVDVPGGASILIQSEAKREDALTNIHLSNQLVDTVNPHQGEVYAYQQSYEEDSKSINQKTNHQGQEEEKEADMREAADTPPLQPLNTFNSPISLASSPLDIDIALPPISGIGLANQPSTLTKILEWIENKVFEMGNLLNNDVNQNNSIIETNPLATNNQLSREISLSNRAEENNSVRNRSMINNHWLIDCALGVAGILIALLIIKRWSSAAGLFKQTLALVKLIIQ